jgi:shikimate dehydrogenase
MIGARTRVFALLGNPVAHSLSPAMHNAAFRALGLDAVYVTLRCDAHHLLGLMEGLVAAGGGGNITVPYKQAAAAAARSPAGETYPAVNTFWGHDGRLVGGDTDRIGIVTGWQRLGEPPGTWLVIGTGGSALAAALAARSLGKPVAVRSRSAVRAIAFLDAIRSAGASPSDRLEGGAFVVNCTPLGLADADPLPIRPEKLPQDATGLDLVYRPGGTAWVRAMNASGRGAADGREVLLGQGAAAFRCWFPGVEPPIEVMRAAVAGALG